MINLIVARGKNGEIGADNKLLWKLPSDMQFFREMTTGNTVVMGRKTWESIGSKPLPSRTNIVITNREVLLIGGRGKKPIFMNMEYFHSFIENYDSTEFGEIFIIGGSSIYKGLAKYVDVMYITEVEQSYPQADTYFEFPEGNWKRILLGMGKDNGLEYKFTKWERE